MQMCRYEIRGREWYCSKDIEPKGGFLEGHQGFLPRSKVFSLKVKLYVLSIMFRLQVYKNITLPKKSWFPVTVAQVSRIKVKLNVSG